MTSLIAVHEIIRSNGQGQREVIAPGSSFDALDEGQYKRLIRAGAARVGKAAAAAVVPAPAPEPAVGPAPAPGFYTTSDLGKLKKAELVEIAKGMDIDTRDKTVAELTDAILAAQDDESVI